MLDSDRAVVDAPIVGATRRAHLADAIEAVRLELTDDEIVELERPYAPRVPTYF